VHGRRAKAQIADYVLVYRNTKLAVVEAKSWDEELTEGLGQAKSYAAKMAIRFTYATNGQGIYGVDMLEGTEGELAQYPGPEELWKLTLPWRLSTTFASGKRGDLATASALCIG
jgi:type I restriction enzyme R subunit